MKNELLKLPERVRVEFGDQARHTRIVNAETGEDIKAIVSIRVDNVNGADIKRKLFIHLTLCASGFIFEGDARYDLSEADMRMVAEHHGYELILPTQCGSQFWSRKKV